jgi:hypothetical protein
MFKKNALNLLFAAFPLFVTAQTDKQFDMIADEACKCASKKDFKSLSKDETTRT